MAGSQTFTFDGTNTLSDLLLVAEHLAATGRRPLLRLIKSSIPSPMRYAGVEIDAEEAPKTAEVGRDLEQKCLAWAHEHHPPTPREMAVTEGAES